MNRGNDRNDIFRDELDFVAFLAQMTTTGRHHEWSILAYCLMPNHFHLVVEADVGAISAGMRDLTGRYARRFHRRHGTRGHLFGGRFRAVPVLGDRQVAAVLRYVETNPVAAGLCGTAYDWPWSSCAALMGRRPPDQCLAPSRLWRLLGHDEEDGRRLLGQLIEPAPLAVSGT
jgi:putative transposase